MCRQTQPSSSAETVWFAASPAQRLFAALTLGGVTDALHEIVSRTLRRGPSEDVDARDGPGEAAEGLAGLIGNSASMARLREQIMRLRGELGWWRTCHAPCESCRDGRARFDDG